MADTGAGAIAGPYGHRSRRRPGAWEASARRCGIGNRRGWCCRVVRYRSGYHGRGRCGILRLGSELAGGAVLRLGLRAEPSCASGRFYGRGPSASGCRLAQLRRRLYRSGLRRGERCRCVVSGGAPGRERPGGAAAVSVGGRGSVAVYPVFLPGRHGAQRASGHRPVAHRSRGRKRCRRPLLRRRRLRLLLDRRRRLRLGRRRWGGPGRGCLGGARRRRGAVVGNLKARAARAAGPGPHGYGSGRGRRRGHDRGRRGLPALSRGRRRRAGREFGANAGLGIGCGANAAAGGTTSGMACTGGPIAPARRRGSPG